MMKIIPTIFQVARRCLHKGASQSILKAVSSFDPSSQAKLLQNLLEHSRREVPYYSRILNDRADYFTNFHKFPILTKGLIRDNFDDLKSRDLSARKWYLNSSGGSTGKPITLVQDEVFGRWGDAAENFFYTHLIGIKQNQTVPKVYIWGSERDLFQQTTLISRLMNLLAARTFINAFHMTGNELNRAVNVINKKKPVILKGYAGSLHELAIFIKNHKMAIHNPTAIHSAAEVLRPYMRQTIEEVFACKVFDFYGSREVGAMAGECRHGQMHIFSFNNLIEVVDDQNIPVNPGGEGRILITTLHNYAMPLIRYDIGDTAVSGDVCSCGINLPTLQRITGRVTDHFLNNDGTLINGDISVRLSQSK